MDGHRSAAATLPRRPPRGTAFLRPLRGRALTFRARRLLLQARDELLEAQLLESLADCLELGRAELDQAAALADEVERLAEPGLAGVEALDDRLQAGGGGLVGLRRGRALSHRRRSSHRRRRRRSAVARRERRGPPRRS